MADSWADIFNGQAEEKEAIEGYVAKFQTAWRRVDHSEIDDEITELEVEAAINKCKAGEAVGPDDLGNEWYQDHIKELVPIQTKLFNDCLNEGTTPSSFVEAYIFSISKGGDTSNPLNYRPIALLNTDYNIFTRILAWRVRRSIAELVHNTQFGFIPGRTIHEAIDLFEAAKERCKRGEDLAEAQVLLLDFAKAYDSLDRDFLFAVLKAKGFPAKFCRIIREIHHGTTVQFMANGSLSEKLKVTSGIRQGCPLAPLLFILAVDVLYDEIEAAGGLKGISLDPVHNDQQLKVAGYADDTAIYIADRSMQAEAIRAVARFSAVSGLMLNVGKCAAIRLGEVKEGDTGELDQQQIAETASLRYLGHVAGTGDTTEGAWEKAMGALRVGLVLAEEKTNTVKQRAAIAAAVIVPKLLYVARHAWPSEKIIKKVDWCIRQFVWKAAFAEPERAAAGWIRAQIAELEPALGGLGIPNIRDELKAMSAMVVSDWALSCNKQIQQVGDILQERDIGQAERVVPVNIVPAHKVGSSLWGTGRPWATYALARESRTKEEALEAACHLRRLMRHCNGLVTRWSTQGLQIKCEGEIRREMQKAKAMRETSSGKCMQRAVQELPLASLRLCDAQGVCEKWKTFKNLTRAADGLKICKVVTIERTSCGGVDFVPVLMDVPLPSGLAHLFRELCLIILANFPELIFPWTEEEALTVGHVLEDKNHLFTVHKEGELEIRHTCESETKKVGWTTTARTMQEAVAQVLDLKSTQVSITPHPWICRLNPVWVGHRRWTLTRKKYKALMRRHKTEEVKMAWSSIQRKWTESDVEIAAALNELTWKRVHALEGVTAYQTQNIIKLKMGRLRLWAGDQLGFGCPRAECRRQSAAGLAHLIRGCPDAKAHWDSVLRRWQLAAGKTESGGGGTGSEKGDKSRL
ncbi:hypothetical protein PF005_g15599 [Phytophthora fragariae]|uniref:Reverse transcriptase domain-containing protein n=1 Tax=Phytophthora fragariae TaxID=53985 RepID=A0A6A3XBK2_9STRA|nr:hypothetical protein PF003_g5339 [Phytophthora fragariae]KAE9135991.1 hypothetical protein PF006_g14487 [Phytophthora fragariae]KAE9199801.1 hypothetical protein PF005_g15599 [Phytophthora fragariae]KAE9216650.1 hypothetical protein PF004_g14398 [Phytophthora fragariae]KAE9300743.1 hypothetical protein PF001_g14795 [Phytophthora fragariae]